MEKLNKTTPKIVEEDVFLEKLVLAQKKAEMELKRIRQVKSEEKQKEEKVIIGKVLPLPLSLRSFKDEIKQVVEARYKIPYRKYEEGTLIQIHHQDGKEQEDLWTFSFLQMKKYSNQISLEVFKDKRISAPIITIGKDTFIPFSFNNPLSILLVQGYLAFQSGKNDLFYEALLRWIASCLSSFTNDNIDIAGFDDTILKCNKLLQCINPEIVNRHILFVGPPGCGKSALARRLVKDNSAMLAIKIDLRVDPEILSAISELAGLCKTRVIIVFDEIDEIGRIRSNQGDSFTFSLLRLLDGVENIKNIKLICTSNQVEVLDPALLRVGRLGPVILIDYPDLEQKQKIFEYYCKKYKVDISAPKELDLRITGCDIRSAFETCIIEEEKITFPLLSEHLDKTIKRKASIGF